MKKYLLLLCLISLPALAALEFKIFTLQHRFASDLLPVVQPMVGLGGTATGMNNQLIIRADSTQMREIEAIVAQLDAAQVNRKITVNSNQTKQSNGTSFGASGTINSGRVVISNGRRLPSNSGRIDIEQNSRNSQQSSQQFITVLDGQRAFIRVGQLVPYTQDWVTIIGRYAQFQQTTDWQDISTGFAVRPRTVGNIVELEITPRIAQLNSQQFIDFEELSTVVRTPLGAWVDIGGLMQQRDEVSQKILSQQSGYSSETSQLTVKVD
ncbi:MAG TPA: secretin N-terminal domain-containing protein [Methylophilus sp.]